MNDLSAEEERLLEKWLLSEAKIDVDGATRALKEASHIWEGFGVTFFLMSGTCLGAIRENGIIPWDDDVDIGSVEGLHGFSERRMDEVVAAFRSNGFLTKLYRSGPNLFLPLVKYSAKVSWSGFPVIDGHIEQYPSIFTPVSLFTDLKEISFLGERFYVPNPPEEYLRLKYGEEWRLPKKAGAYERDVVNLVIADWAPNDEAGEPRDQLAGDIPREQTCRIKVLDESGNPAEGAEVIIIGLGNRRTDENGSADFHVPQADYYPVVIRYGDRERIDYFPRIAPGDECVYRMTG